VSLLRTILVEDEPHARARLRKCLQPFADVEIVGEAGDGQTAIEMIDALRPDLAFLDVELPEVSGIEVLVRVRHRPLVVFVTAYDRYAVQAFEENALDYLLKPTTEARLARAIERVRAARGGLDDATIEALRRTLSRSRCLRQIPVRQGDTILLVPTATVWWLTAEDRQVVLHTQDRDYAADLTLKDLENDLDPERFVRIHRGVIVARDRIARISRSFGGRYSVRMADEEGTSFEIGRSHLPHIRKLLRF
jgi:two-component system LytT family response regulator